MFIKQIGPCAAKAVARRCTRFASDVAPIKSVPGLVFNPRINAVLSPPDTNVTTLGNGFRVASEDWGGPLTTVGIWVDLGSRYERDHENGASTLLENTFYEGTEKRDKHQFLNELGRLTCFSDAYTTRQQMAVYAVCYPKDVEKTVELLADMVLHPRFDKETFERVRAKCLRKLDTDDQNPRAILDHYAHMMAYMNTPLENPPSGRYQIIQNMNPDVLANYHKNHVKAHRTVLAAAGGVDHKQLAELGQKYFGNLGNDYEDEVPSVQPCRYTGSFVFHREDSWPHCYIMLGFEAPGWDNVEDMTTFMVAKHIMGQWDKSHTMRESSPYRLAQHVAADNYLQLFDTFYHPYYKTGLFGSYHVVEETKADDFAKNLQWEWRYLCTLTTDRDVQIGKNFLKRELCAAAESTPTVCDRLATQILRYNKRISLVDAFARIDAVDSMKVKDTFDRQVYDRDPVIVGFGRTGQQEFVGWWWVRRRMYWWMA